VFRTATQIVYHNCRQRWSGRPELPLETFLIVYPLAVDLAGVEYVHAGLDQERDEISNRSVAVEEDEGLGQGPALEEMEQPAMVRPDQVLIHRQGNQRPGLGAKIVGGREDQPALVEQVEHAAPIGHRALELFGHDRVDERGVRGHVY